MCKVLSEFTVAEKYKLLSVDELPQKCNYKKYVINGVEYDPVTVYDIPNCIAIGETKSNMVGEEVTFV